MDFKEIEVTKEKIANIPESNFQYGTWQANYFIPVQTCKYDPETKLYSIDANIPVDKENVAKYLDINACTILPDGTKEISYLDFLKLDEIKFFKIERNELNNQWMVHSSYLHLNQCYHKKGKKSAQTLCDELNVQANKEYEKFGKPEDFIKLR
jgi:hypothetical protein